MAAPASVQAVPEDVSPRRASRPARPAILAAVFAVAFLARLLPVLRGGGLGFYGRYDDGVYYAAAESLSFGHVPYRDFVLLHPPGIAIELLPFTILGRLTSDPTGMTAARLTFMALGGLNAVLVALIAGRWGWTRGAFAGLLYAASAAAIYDEETTNLEPVATALVLVAMLALSRRTLRSDPRLEMIAGAALGLACCTKIWYGPVLVLLVVVTALWRDARAAVRVLMAGAITTVIVMLPFFALAPDRMWTMVIDDQLGRNMAGHRIGRIQSFVGIENVFAGADNLVVQAATVALVVLLLVALAFCLADRGTWMIAGLFIVSTVILMASPSYFRHYGVLLAAPIALLLPVGLGQALRLLRPAHLRVAIGTLGAALALASGVRIALSPAGARFPADAFAAAAPAGCIASDDPAALIQMNRLSQGFRSHCDIPVDVTGAGYGAPMPRAVNTAFQAWLMEHLAGGDAFVVLRAHGDPLSSEELRVIRHHHLLASGDGVALRSGGPDHLALALGSSPQR